MKIVKAAWMGLLASLVVAVAAPVWGEGSPVNINTATVAELQAVKGIGSTKARAIVDHRDENGEFATVEDLQLVTGIGGKLLERLRPQVTVADGLPDSERK